MFWLYKYCTSIYKYFRRYRRRHCGKYIRTVEVVDIMKLKEHELIDKLFCYSPRIGFTFVEIFNPWTSSGLRIHQDFRTKYVCFNCKLHYIPDSDGQYKLYKAHRLEIPLRTCFRKYKEQIIFKGITEDVTVYCLVYREEKFKYHIRFVPKQAFFEYLENSMQNQPLLRELIKGERTDILLE